MNCNDPRVAPALDETGLDLSTVPRSSTAATVVATLGVIAALWWGRRFAIPVVAGLVLAMLIAPAVLRAARVLRSEMLATTVGLSLVLITLFAAAYAFGGQLLRVTDRVPEVLSLAADRLKELDPGANTVLARTRSALRDLDGAVTRWSDPHRAIATIKPARAATRGVATANAAASNPTPISDGATNALKATALSGTSVLLNFAGDLVIILFVAFFLLSGGARMSERFIDLWGPNPPARKHALSALLECARLVRNYAWVLLVTNTAIGLLVWLFFALIDLPDAAGWAVAAAVLHLVPYLGMALLTVFAAAEAFLAYGSLGAAFGVATILVLASTLIGTLAAARLQGHAARMNSAAIFIGIVFWGALWGVWGLFLGPVLVVAFKVFAEHCGGHRIAGLLRA